MESMKIKKTGTREQVFKGLALTTAGGLKKDDIIEKKFGNKIHYISRKLSDKMKENINIIRTNNPNFYKRMQKKTMVNNDASQQPNVQTQLPNRKKTVTKTQKLAFKVKENEVRTVFYPELKGMDIKELKEELLREEAEEDMGIQLPKKTEFKIEEIPDIDINEL
jgi:hypothetical protein